MAEVSERSVARFRMHGVSVDVAEKGNRFVAACQRLKLIGEGELYGEAINNLYQQMVRLEPCTADGSFVMSCPALGVKGVGLTMAGAYHRLYEAIQAAVAKSDAARTDDCERNPAEATGEAAVTWADRA